MTRLLLPCALALAVLAGGWAAAQTGTPAEARALLIAKRDAQAAASRARQLERAAAGAAGEAARARADAAALIAKIAAAETEITAAETRVAIIERLRAGQRARLAARQGPVVRLTAALQTMARRPPALALLQPGSLEELVHLRSLLASTMPVIRARTAAVRAEIEAGNALRRQADVAVAALQRSRATLRAERVALAAFEARQRERSQALAGSATFESDRALALGEQARDLGELVGTLDEQARVRRRLAALPGPLPRPGGAAAATPPRRSAYILPVEGRLVTGLGEISDSGVHARGLSFRTRAGVPVVAPAAGRVAYAGVFRGYESIVIIDHGRGWLSLITNLDTTSVAAGDSVARGGAIGRAAGGDAPVTVELRRGGRPVSIAALVAGG